MSSRKKYLTPAERKEAVCLFQSLEKAKALFAAGERDAERIQTAVRTVIQATSGKVDYIEIVDDETLQPVPFDPFDKLRAGEAQGRQSLEKPALLALAVKFSGARLIDNTVLR
jgi:pantoate--beta-alanine ligase